MKWIKIATLIVAVIFQVQEISGFIEFDNNFCDSARLLSGSINLNDSPLNFEVEVPNAVVSGEVISIKINNFDGDQLRGILIEAKSSEGTSIGIFIPNKDFNSTVCKGNLATIYENTESENEMIIKWQSPVIEEAINFRF